MYYLFIEDKDIEEVESIATSQSIPAGKNLARCVDIFFIINIHLIYRLYITIAIFAYKSY